jgi:hypothetical protein
MSLNVNLRTLESEGPKILSPWVLHDYCLFGSLIGRFCTMNSVAFVQS